jgi:hypothetical protein
MENTSACVHELAVADRAPFLGFQQVGEEERHCSLSSPMGKSGRRRGSRRPAAPMPLRTPQGKSEAGHLGLKPRPLLLCGLGLALSGGTELAALFCQASWRKKTMGSHSRLAGELGGGGVVPAPGGEKKRCRRAICNKTGRIFTVDGRP